MPDEAQTSQFRFALLRLVSFVGACAVILALCIYVDKAAIMAAGKWVALVGAQANRRSDPPLLIAGLFLSCYFVAFLTVPAAIFRYAYQLARREPISEWHTIFAFGNIAAAGSLLVALAIHRTWFIIDMVYPRAVVVMFVGAIAAVIDASCRTRTKGAILWAVLAMVYSIIFFLHVCGYFAVVEALRGLGGHRG